MDFFLSLGRCFSLSLSLSSPPLALSLLSGARSALKRVLRRRLARKGLRCERHARPQEQGRFVHVLSPCHTLRLSPRLWWRSDGLRTFGRHGGECGGAVAEGGAGGEAQGKYQGTADEPQSAVLGAVPRTLLHPLCTPWSKRRRVPQPIAEEAARLAAFVLVYHVFNLETHVRLGGSILTKLLERGKGRRGGTSTPETVPGER